MKKSAILAAAATAVISTSAFAQVAPSLPDNQANGSAVAEVVAPITVVHVVGAELNFGKFTAGTGGTVVVSRGGNGSTTGDVVLVAGSIESADQFAVVGDPDRLFSVTTGDGSIELADGSASMDFTTDATSNRRLNAAGAATFPVGGTLTVAANQKAGDYTGEYLVEVAYY